jgi:hypothetical protein
MEGSGTSSHHRPGGTVASSLGGPVESMEPPLAERLQQGLSLSAAAASSSLHQPQHQPQPQQQQQQQQQQPHRRTASAPVAQPPRQPGQQQQKPQQRPQRSLAVHPLVMAFNPREVYWNQRQKYMMMCMCAAKAGRQNDNASRSTRVYIVWSTTHAVPLNTQLPTTPAQKPNQRLTPPPPPQHTDRSKWKSRRRPALSATAYLCGT